MTKNPIVPLLYGYLVCLGAILTFLIGVSMLSRAALDYQHPLRANGGYSSHGDTSSFETYKLTYVYQYGPKGESLPRPSDEELRSAYDLARQDNIDQGKFQAGQNMINGILLIVAAVILFAFHWRWLSKINKQS